MQRSISLVTIILLMSLVFTGGNCLALKHTTDKSPVKPIRVGLYSNYPIVYEASAQPTGFHLELLKEAAKLENWVLKYQFLGSKKNVLQALKDQTIDLSMGFVPTSERQQYLDFTTEKNAIINGQIIVKSDDNSVSSMESLRDKHIAFINHDELGSQVIEIFDKVGIAATFTMVRSNNELINAVLFSTVDAAICNNLEAKQLAAKYSVKLSPVFFKPVEVQFVVPKGTNKHIIEALDQHLHQWKTSTGSVFYKMDSKFLTDPTPQKPKFSNRELLIAFCVCLLFIVTGIVVGNFLASENEHIRPRLHSAYIRKIVLFTLIMSLAFWFLDSALEWLFFNDLNQLTFLELSFSQIPPEKLYIRGMFFLLCCFFGFFMARYISKHEQLLETVLHSVNRFEQLMDNCNGLLFRINLSNHESYEFVSKASLKITGYGPEQFYRNPNLLRELVHPDCKEYFKGLWNDVLAGQVQPYYEYQIRNKAGELRWLAQRNTLYFDKSGIPTAVEGIITDISAQKIPEQLHND